MKRAATEALCLPPIAEEFQSIMHLGGGAGVKEFQQTAQDDARFQLVGHDDAAVMLPIGKVTVVQTRKVATIEGE